MAQTLPSYHIASKIWLLSVNSSVNSRKCSLPLLSTKDKVAILLLYSAAFLTFDYNVVSPLQKLIDSLLSLLVTEIIKNGTAHIKQNTRPTIPPIILITSLKKFIFNFLIIFCADIFEILRLVYRWQCVFLDMF